MAQDDLPITLILDRLKRIEAQNDAQLTLLHKHLEDDATLKSRVDRHDVYFKSAGATVGLGLPALITYLLTKLGVR